MRSWHGIGPNTLKKLQAALTSPGLNFAAEKTTDEGTVDGSVGTCENDLVAVGIAEPDFPVVGAAVAIGRIAVARQEGFRAERFGPRDGRVNVIEFESEEHAVPRRLVIRIADPPVVMLLLPAVQLQDELSRHHQPLIVRPVMRALAAQQPLIPQAARLNIADAD